MLMELTQDNETLTAFEAQAFFNSTQSKSIDLTELSRIRPITFPSTPIHSLNILTDLFELP